MKKYFYTISLVMILLFTNISVSQVPETINYQGHLSNSAGTAVTDADYQITFSLYDNIDSEDAIWTEIQTVKTKSGFINVYLGSINPFSGTLDFDVPYWLEIKIGSSGEALPRVRLSTVPYSFTAKSIVTNGGGEGNVLTIRDSKAVWMPSGSSLYLPFSGSADTIGQAMKIVQYGKGSAGQFSSTIFNKTANDIKDPVLSVKIINKKRNENDPSEIPTFINSVFSSEGALSNVTSGRKKINQLNDNTLNAGAKVVGFFCLDSAFDKNRSDEITVEDQASVYSRTLSAEGHSGKFVTDNPENHSSTFFIQNQGLGNSIFINSLNPFNHFPALYTMNRSRDTNTFTIVAESEGIAGGVARFIQKDSNAQGLYPAFNVQSYGKINTATFLSENIHSFYPVVGIEGKSIGKILNIYSKNSSNDSVAMNLRQFGNGPGARFEILKKENSATTLVANNEGLGRAGQFYCSNPNNQQTALGGIHSGQGVAVSGYTDSKNANAGLFYTDHTQNDLATLDVYQQGVGYAGCFDVLNTSSTMATLGSHSNGPGPAIYGRSDGTGRVASFEQKNANGNNPAVYISSANDNEALFVKNNSSGPAAQFRIDAYGNSNTVLIVNNQVGGKGMVCQSTNQTSDPALEVIKDGANNTALLCRGTLEVIGNVTKQGGSFKIDHPLDPENKYLYHSFVESPDMMNIYNGNIILDDNGEAIVTLPDWFQALNMEFRYQLTCIGGFAQVYIEEEVNDNHFKIAGGKKGLKVSWQVTGIRHDKYAEKYRISVEENKPNTEKGTYLAPEAFGKSYNTMKQNKTQGSGTKSQNDLNLPFNNSEKAIRNIKQNEECPKK